MKSAELDITYGAGVGDVITRLCMHQNLVTAGCKVVLLHQSGLQHQRQHWCDCKELSTAGMHTGSRKTKADDTASLC